MKTKSQIEKQLKRKTNPELVKTLINSKKNAKWLEVGTILSYPRRKKIAINIDKLEKKADDKKINLIPGKVLSQGALSKKINVCARAFSEKAREKILNAGGKVSLIVDEIKSNPDAKNIKIIK
jgi:large subunit ribosomal protein L18e